jgi:hypothetical protein
VPIAVFISAIFYHAPERGNSLQKGWGGGVWQGDERHASQVLYCRE